MLSWQRQNNRINIAYNIIPGLVQVFTCRNRSKQAIPIIISEYISISLRLSDYLINIFKTTQIKNKCVL